MRYPESLVHEYGAKAGVLMYVAEECPDIPQAPMVVSNVAKKMRSRYIGTYIRHPNVPDSYLMSLTCTEINPFFGALKFVYAYQPSKGLMFLKEFTNVVWAEDAPILGSEISTVISWHDRVVSLPEMDSNWAYQVEFGLYPTCLFQIRPFKPYEQANFKVPEDDWIFQSFTKPIVIGITSPEGILARVRHLKYNYAFEMFDNLPEEGEPVVVVDDLRSAELARRLPNHQANLC